MAESNKDTEISSNNAEHKANTPETIEVENTFEKNKEKALQLKDDGNTSFKSGDYDKSILLYTEALQFCPLEEAELVTTLYSNLAAAKDHVGAIEEAINCCNEALSLNERHPKALLRRAQLYRKSDKLDESLSDYQKFLEFYPTDKNVRLSIDELKIQIDERNEKLKTEMLSKLKDLGNVVLKPFGLSTENFQLVKNQDTGSYSVNFQNQQ